MSFRSLCNAALVGLAAMSLGTGVLIAAAVGATGAAAANPALQFGVASVTFPNPITLGDFTVLQSTLTNNSGTTDTISGFTASGANPNDFGLTPRADCPADAAGDVVLASGAMCHMIFIFLPGALGQRTATLTLTDTQNSGTHASVTGTGSIGYYQVSSNGAVANFGDAALFGDASGLPLNHPIVGIAQTGDDGGYWLVANDGGIFNYGDASFFGSAGGLRLNKPIVGMASTTDGAGYWLVASDGGIFAYGDAPFYGSTGALHLNKPVVGMAPTPGGGGYWFVASDGGIFSYGNAQFYGSTGGIVLNKPVVGMAPTPDGGGYWLVASDGGIFAYGDAQFYGSTGAIHLNQPINGMAAMPTGHGYWFTAADGGLFNYGDAPFSGSAAGQNLGGPVVAMATDGEPTLQAFTDSPAIRHAHGAGTAGWASLPTAPRFAGRR